MFTHLSGFGLWAFWHSYDLYSCFCYGSRQPLLRWETKPLRSEKAASFESTSNASNAQEIYELETGLEKASFTYDPTAQRWVPS